MRPPSPIIIRAPLTREHAGKANLSEWSYFRGQRGELPSGWSGRGGQTTNAYFPNGDPCGSSAGSGVSASIGLAAVTLGTETDGSIICPSSLNNVVGIKPTVGLTSRAGGVYLPSHTFSVLGLNMLDFQ